MGVSSKRCKWIIANSEDPDQTAPRSSLIWVCTVCLDLYVRKVWNLYFPWHHSYFREDFRLLLEVHKGKLVATSCTWLHIIISMQSLFDKFENIDCKNKYGALISEPRHELFAYADRVTAKLINAFVFTTQIVQITLLPKSEFLSL